jgi:hypothetical protein
VNAQIMVDGGLMFENAAVEAGVATAPTEYRFTWSRFDNATGATSQEVTGITFGRTSGIFHGVRIETPKALLDSAFLRVSIRSIHPDYPAWANPVTFTFRRNGTQWETVGLDRTSKSVVQK